MRKYLLLSLLTLLGSLAFSQVPDTTTLEKKARWHTAQVKNNKTRAITGLSLQKTFQAVTNLALQSVFPDTITFPAVDRLADSYREGISMFSITTAEGWPVNGTLLVERNADGHTVQTVTASDSPFLDQRKRSTNTQEGSPLWSFWDIVAITVTYDPPSLAAKDHHDIYINIPGVDGYSRIRRLIVSEPVGVVKINAVIQPTDNELVNLYSYNSGNDTVDAPLVTVTIYIED